MGIKVVASGVFLPNLFDNFYVLTTSLFTTLLNFFKYIGTVFSLPTFKSSTFVFKLFVNQFFNI